MLERVSDPAHPNTLTARTSLAYWTGEAGDPAAARDAYAALLPIRERVSGPEHPDTLAARANLARWTRQAPRRRRRRRPPAVGGGGDPPPPGPGARPAGGHRGPVGDGLDLAGPAGVVLGRPDGDVQPVAAVRADVADVQAGQLGPAGAGEAEHEQAGVPAAGHHGRPAGGQQPGQPVASNPASSPAGST